MVICPLLALSTGVGLMEIITEPDFRSAEEVSAFVKELSLILSTIGTCSGKMEGLVCNRILFIFVNMLAKFITLSACHIY